MESNVSLIMKDQRISSFLNNLPDLEIANSFLKTKSSGKLKLNELD
jgi:hypothetical protein